MNATSTVSGEPFAYRQTGKQEECQESVLGHITAKYTDRGVVVEQFFHIYMGVLNINVIVS